MRGRVWSPVLLVLWCALCLLVACTGGEPQYPVDNPATATFQELTQVIPAAGLPKEVIPQKANNNLDVIVFEDRIFLAIRTAPSHFASEKAMLYIMSRVEGKPWEWEATINLKRDLREPRFFAWKGKLFLYFAQLGTNSIAFEPGQAMRVERNKKGDWTTPAKAFDIKGFIPWRIKIHNGTPLLIGYDNGDQIYKFGDDRKPLNVYLLTTKDGLTWTPYNPKKPVVLKGGNSETDFAFDREGNLYAVARNEAGDDGGFGSRICTAPKDDLTNWTCKTDRKKYDSPLLFSFGGEVYLIGRRNLTKSGDYDLQIKSDSFKDKLWTYQGDYSIRPKRCSLWYIRRDKLQVEYRKDLPSKGDTCFPSIITHPSGKLVVYNYSSPVNGKDFTWYDGQNNPTMIYSHRLVFTPLSGP